MRASARDVRSGDGRRGEAYAPDVSRVICGTADGVVAIGAAGEETEHLGLAGRRVDALAPASWRTLWAALDGGEIWRRRDEGWERVGALADAGAGDLEVRCLADTRANEEGGVLVGTSRARLFRIGAGGGVVPVEGFDAAPDRAAWHTPWGGPPDTRTISEDADRVYVNVHVGGVLRSADEGRTFVPTIDIDTDVHRVVTGKDGRVVAAAAEGIWLSDDQGDSWHHSDAGLEETYCRSVAVCGETLLASASAGPRGERAGLYRSLDGGRSFSRCRNGLPEHVDGNIDSLRLDALPSGELAAFATASGDCYLSLDQGESWAHVASGLTGVSCVLVWP